jgi:hypothetical protein
MRGPSFAVPPPAPVVAPPMTAAGAAAPTATASSETTLPGVFPSVLSGGSAADAPTLPPEPRLSLPAIEASVGRPLSDTDFNVERTRFPELKPRRQTWATVALVVVAAVVVGLVLKGSLGGKRALRGRGGADVRSARGALEVEPVADPELAPPPAPSARGAAEEAAALVPEASAAATTGDTAAEQVANVVAPGAGAPSAEAAGAGAVAATPGASPSASASAAPTAAPTVSGAATRAQKASARARRDAARAEARGDVSAESVTATYRELAQAIDAIYHTRGASYAKPFHERLVKTPLNQALADPARRSRFAAELDRLREDMRRAGVL